MPVEVVALAEHPVEQTSEFVGTVKSLRSTTVQAQAEGFLTAVHAKSGDRVTAGTVLFEVDSRSQQAAVAGLESVRAAREAEANVARQEAERARKLFAAGAASRQEVDRTEAQQKATEAQLRAIEEQIRQQKNELGYSKVTASVGGVIGDVPVRVGDRITRQTPLTMIEDNSALELYVNVPVQEAPRLKTGLTVRLLDDTGKVVGTERIHFVSPSVDETTQTVLIKAPAGARGLRADQFVRVRILWSTEPALTVPVVAVTRVGPQYFVFVAEPGDGGALVARQKPVTIGTLVGNDYILLGGLKAGDKLITGGIQKIRDGAQVQIAPAGPPKPAAPSGKVSRGAPASDGHEGARATNVLRTE